MRIAVVGSGIAGNLVANLLCGEHEVDLYEACGYPGGHTNTVDVDLEGESFPVDTGFMVFNDRTYPNFCQMLDRLGVASRPAEMSFGVRCDRTGLEYQGSSLNGLFAQRRNLMRPKFLKMLSDIQRFHRLCHELLDSDEGHDWTLEDFVRRHGMGRGIVDDYLAPMCAAIWSAPTGRVLEAPARYFVHFFKNHGLIQLRDRPQWRTILGGARTYVERLLAPLADRVKLNSPVKRVVRSDAEVLVETADTSQAYERVVMATHADTTLKLLADADALEREVLGAFPYQDNLAVVHTDTSLLPRRTRAWASWNYRRLADPSAPLSVTYDVSRLQGHASATPILVTLNDPSIDPAAVHAQFSYAHPQHHLGVPQAQARHEELSGRRRTWFAGAYWGYGFHEDGVKSALVVAKAFGKSMEDLCTVASTRASSGTVGAAT